MQYLDDAQVKARLSWPALIGALEAAFARRAAEPGYFVQPERLLLKGQGSYLVMPCLDGEGYFGVKQVAVLPHNPARGLPGVQAHYTLFDASGTPALSCSATLLTRLRTAAVSALAAKYLAPAAPETLLVVGTGGLAPVMAEAHCQVRRYRRVLVWGRRRERAQQTAAAIRAALGGLEVVVADDLVAALAEAEVISAATSARAPLIPGAALRPGQHLDLVGAFTPEMAEADAEAVKRADVFVDERAACLQEAGDLIQAQAQGWSWELVEGDLSELVSGRAKRQAPQRLTLFKSVGLALEDLVAAKLLLA